MLRHPPPEWPVRVPTHAAEMIDVSNNGDSNQEMRRRAFSQANITRFIEDNVFH